MKKTKQRASAAPRFVTYPQFAGVMPIHFTLLEAMRASQRDAFPSYVRVPHRKSPPRWEVQQLERWISDTFGAVMTEDEVKNALDKFRAAVAVNAEEPAMT